MKQNAGTGCKTEENELDHRGANYNGQIWHIPFLLYFSISTRKQKVSRFFRNLGNSSSSSSFSSFVETGIINIFVLLLFLFIFLRDFLVGYLNKIFDNCGVGIIRHL